MFNLLKNTILLALLLSAAAWRPAVLASTPLDAQLTVTSTSPGAVTLTWDVLAGSGPYSVSVQDLTTNQRVTDFTTTATTANVSGLMVGHTCRFSVSRGEQIIITETIME